MLKGVMVLANELDYDIVVSSHSSHAKTFTFGLKSFENV